MPHPVVSYRMRYVMGDVHGDAAALEAVLTKAAFDFERDKLIQLGDVCDRGPDSYQCVELLLRCKNLIAVRGNHDAWFLEFIQTGRLDPAWLDYGGLDTLHSYDQRKLPHTVHREFYEAQRPYYIDQHNFLYVHGGILPSLPIARQNGHVFYWDRSLCEAMMRCRPNERIPFADGFAGVYIGHTPTLNFTQRGRPVTVPISRGGITNVDTGCGKPGGWLSMLNLDNGLLFGVPSTVDASRRIR